MPMQLERWISFLQVDADTLATLRDFVSEIEPHFDSILDTFYSRVQDSEAAAALFTSSASMDRAREAQRFHWLAHVLRGRFDQEYLASARAIGQTHYRVGVDLMM
ncbi:protoglobin domain-containing protein [Magnetospirillum gryphiswaldense]|uniref:Methyl-accepting chemotaxis protein n=1 Tax=Magnetospirillum gryphiswaldense TaxID=55518 RepID=A4U3G9_9PROT|nr:protoglobin domain-containing protein [Magnetospirillum gryphiswaldense]AVM75765.1 hypothetical protein MSR1_33000 [Magnetospirillum gryphiswaldense MSR-1]AVM79668.1 hypothetical protein MSR1L_33000 [Magnetospirillum gryphiswaldense]CAM77426.1 Methyl-accepting chemotaxis protein [Magnetospirillum gryphiswaldense MSR-1]